MGAADLVSRGIVGSHGGMGWGGTIRKGGALWGGKMSGSLKNLYSRRPIFSQKRKEQKKGRNRGLVKPKNILLKS